MKNLHEVVWGGVWNIAAPLVARATSPQVAAEGSISKACPEPSKGALMGPRTVPAPLRLANHRHSGESRNEEQKLQQALADRPMSLSEIPVPVRKGSMDFVGADLCVRPPRMPIATPSRRAEIRKLGGHTGPPLQLIRLGITSPLALDALHHLRHSGVGADRRGCAVGTGLRACPDEEQQRGETIQQGCPAAFQIRAGTEARPYKTLTPKGNPLVLLSGGEPKIRPKRTTPRGSPLPR